MGNVSVGITVLISVNIFVHSQQTLANSFIRRQPVSILDSGHQAIYQNVNI